MLSKRYNQPKSTLELRSIVKALPKHDVYKKTAKRKMTSSLCHYCAAILLSLSPPPFIEWKKLSSLPVFRVVSHKLSLCLSK